MMNSLLYGAGVGAGGAFLTGGSVGSGLRAVTDATLTVSTAAAQHPNAGHACVLTCGAVTVLSFPAGITLTVTTAALPVIWNK